MMPHDPEAERAIIGAALLDHRIVDTVRSSITRDDFYLKRNAQMFAAICAMNDLGEVIDEVTLAAKLLPDDHTAEQKTQLAVALGNIVLQTPSAAHASAYAQVIAKTSRQRKLIDLGDKLKAAAMDDPDQAIHLASRELYALADTGRGRMVKNSKQAARSAMAELERLKQSPEAGFGLLWGFEQLDSVLGGSQPCDLVIIAARPAMGKTTFMLNLAANATTKGGKAGLILELEMSTDQLVMKWIASQGRVNATSVKRGTFTSSDHNRMHNAIGKLAEATLTFDETPFSTIVDLRLLARKLRTQGQLDFICIDYLQLMVATRDRGNREQEIAEISRGLKGLAKELQIPVFALSQLNRSVEQRANKRPMISDLRESGAIEQDADVIVFLYRDEVYNENTEEPGVCEIIIGKNRHGATDTVKLAFQKDTQRFEELPGGRR